MDLHQLDDDELKLVVKSLSITYDALSKKLERLHGRHYREALDETEVCNRVLSKARDEQQTRWRSTAS